MAYLDIARTFSPASLDDPALALNRLERDVLLLSRRDGRSSLIRSRPWWFEILGIRPSTALADPRLEALRRFAVLLRRKGARLAESEVRRLAEAGYSTGQIAHARLLLSQEARRSSSNGLRIETLWPATMASLFGGWLYRATARQVEEPLIALIVTALAFLALLPTVLPRRFA